MNTLLNSEFDSGQKSKIEDQRLKIKNQKLIIKNQKSKINSTVIAGLTRNPKMGMLKHLCFARSARQVQHDVLSQIVLCLLVMFSSCTGKFEEYNTHPTNPRELTKPERTGILFPDMLRLMHNEQENRNQMIEQMIGNQYGGYMVTTNNWQGRNFGTFNPPPEWIAYPFEQTFTRFYPNYLKVKEITEGKGYIYAWANVIRVAVMLRIADTYGPIPYSQMGDGKVAVEYDDVQDLYYYMIEDLDNSILALTAFVSEAGVNNPMSDYDIVYKGDFSKWIKFANSLKLRMAVRIGLVDTEYAKEVMNKAIAGGCIEANGDNAYLPATKNPYHLSAFVWQDLAISATLGVYLNGWNDPRRSVYMTETGYQFRGARMGVNNVDKNIYGDPTLYSKPNFHAESPLMVYNAAETYFLQAEAALRGWITGNAQTLYERGIDLSMEQHRVAVGSYKTTTANVQNYQDHWGTGDYNCGSSANGGTVTVSWSSNATGTSADERRLEKIITQKWLANFPLGFETWCDFRRTGYPRIFPAHTNHSSAGTGGAVNNPTTIGNGSGVTPGPVRLVRRLPYPVSEYNGNSVNVQNAVDMLGGPDEFATNLWWARK